MQSFKNRNFSQEITFDGDFVLAGAGVSEQVNLNAHFTDATFFHAWQIYAQKEYKKTKLESSVPDTDG
jgi:hypothetical protein